MRVYHFIAEKWAKEALKTKRLKVSNINTLNDPFELHAGFSKPNNLLRDTFRDFKEEISKEIGILCFSKLLKDTGLIVYNRDLSSNVSP